MITSQQLAYFNTFGFIHMRRLFAPREITAILHEAENLWQRERQRRHMGDDDYLHMAPFIENSPALLNLLEDDRIYQIVEKLLGSGFLWSGSEGNTGAAQENAFHAWHCDRPGEAEPTYRRLKIMIYLTPMTKDTGCLRVIPGSHRLPMYRELDVLNAQGADTSERMFGVDGEELPCFALETEPGDVIVFNHYLYHAVYRGDGQRRYIAMKFVSPPQTEAHLASLLDRSPYIFEPDDVLLGSRSERIQHMVAGIAPLKQQARALRTAC